jgi:hypothetical protein
MMMSSVIQQILEADLTEETEGVVHPTMWATKSAEVRDKTEPVPGSMFQMDLVYQGKKNSLSILQTGSVM